MKNLPHLKWSFHLKWKTVISNKKRSLWHFETSSVVHYCSRLIHVILAKIHDKGGPAPTRTKVSFNLKGVRRFHTNSSWQMSFPIANAWDDEPSANSQGTSEQCRPLKFFISNFRLHQYHPRKQISSRRCLFDPSILFRCTIICLANLFLQNQHNGSQRQWPSHSPARGRTCICFHGLSYQLVCM